MGIFSFAVKENSASLDKREPPKDDNIFKYIWNIYDIIREGNLDYKEKLNNVLKNVDQSKYGFIVWVLNHCLVYNKFTRDNLELFTLVSNTFLTNLYATLFTMIVGLSPTLTVEHLSKSKPFLSSVLAIVVL